MRGVLYAISKEYAQHYKDSLKRLYEMGGLKNDERYKKLKDIYAAVQGSSLSNKVFYETYVNILMDNLYTIELLSPNELEKIVSNDDASLYKEFYDKNLKKLLSETLTVNGTERKFFDHVVKALLYDDLRDIVLPIYKEMGIKACVYCNAQYISIFKYFDSEKGRIQVCGTCELDHYYDKATWPCFAISFYNLIPSCSKCNNIKRNNKLKFKLYTNDPIEISPFVFSLDDESLARYLLSHQSNSVEILFNPSSYLLNKKYYTPQRSADEYDNDFQECCKLHKEILHITELYNSHRDIVEKMILRYRSLTKSYKDQLLKMYEKIDARINMSYEEFLYGFIDSPNRIHEEPFSKLKQDVLNQIDDCI